MANGAADNGDMWATSEESRQQIMVHVIADTERHTGHADILREHIDGSVGLRADNSNVPPADAAWWQNYRAQVEDAAREATN